MGMAAGQARLLSITSRISDNELRSQIISNNKMRLATESSQVSEAYIAALNDAQYMFTNYDANNNASFQQLTFNALTSYNPYNNQYALINSSNQILISERDAANYRGANGDLEQFLKFYGLEKDTSYFEVLPKDDKGFATYTYYGEDNRVITASCGFTPEVLKKAYFGEPVGDIISMIGGDCPVENCGYDNVLNGPEMHEYISKLGTYTAAKYNYESLVKQAMSDKLDLLVKGNSIFNNSENGSVAATNIVKLIEKIDKTTDEGELKNIYDALKNQFFNGVLKNYATEDGKKSLDDILQNTLNHFEGGSLGTKTYTVNKTLNAETDDNGTTIYKLNIGNWRITFDTSGTVKEAKYCTGEDSDGKEQLANAEGSYPNYSYDDNGKQHTLSLKNLKISNNQGTVETTTVDPDTMKSAREDAMFALQFLKSNLSGIWDSTNVEFCQIDKDISKAMEDYVKAANDLYLVIYNPLLDSNGNTVDRYTAEDTKGATDPQGNSIPDGLLDVVATAGPPYIGELDDIAKLYNEQAQNSYPTFQDSFRPVYMNLVLDNVMDTYGEPKITWINKQDPDDNSMAKMQWYTNLWNRIEQSGYHVLKDGLASSPEWIEFAFESGIVTMEQVDSFNNWNQLIYTNCSDITEQTNDKAVTIAEAEYNAAMNKIENKDKMYDLELKNIDTEHNSLQTEYESIKSALDKNIERNFKYLT